MIRKALSVALGVVLFVGVEAQAAKPKSVEIKLSKKALETIKKADKLPPAEIRAIIEAPAVVAAEAVSEPVGEKERQPAEVRRENRKEDYPRRGSVDLLSAEFKAVEAEFLDLPT